MLLKKLNRLLSIVVFLFLFAAVAFAQDVITLKNGVNIKASVQEIGTDEVKYKNWDNQNGPNFTLKKSEIFCIVYANGSVNNFSELPPFANPVPLNNVQNEECTLSFCNLSAACSDATFRMSWEDAMKNAPVGYRLPTIAELQCMIKTLKTSGGLFQIEYWSCEESGTKKAYSVSTNDCEKEKNKKDELFSVRYVKK